MQHWILRCKHCNREYTYCTYGNGPEFGTDEGCSKEYCADCQKAIDEALSAIPKKFEERFEEIHDDKLIEKLEKVKSETAENYFNFSIYEPEDSTFDIIETYYYDSHKYKVKYDEGSENDKHIFVSKEYDIINRCFTGNLWRYNERNSYRKQRNFHKDMVDSFKMLTLANEFKLPEPTGKLFWFMPDI